MGAFHWQRFEAETKQASAVSCCRRHTMDNLIETLAPSSSLNRVTYHTQIAQQILNFLLQDFLFLLKSGLIVEQVIENDLEHSPIDLDFILDNVKPTFGFEDATLHFERRGTRSTAKQRQPIRVPEIVVLRVSLAGQEKTEHQSNSEG